jgi:NADPH-dependent ferric siderophore reductase
MSQINPNPEQTGRRRRPPQRVEVVSVARLTPRLVSVSMRGPLEGFDDLAPTSHIKVFLPQPGQSEPDLPVFGEGGAEWPDGSSRPVVRSYTPRRYDPATQTLDVEFFIHGKGPASVWAARARPGDRLAIAGPGGRFSFDPPTERWWIAGDESALPAVGTLLDALPETAHAQVHLEVAGADDEMDLDSPADIEVVWHHRAVDGWGGELDYAARRANLDRGTRVWVAGEARAVRAIRRYLMTERGLPAALLVTRGYWRLGEADHPDHDYGED